MTTVADHYQYTGNMNSDKRTAATACRSTTSADMKAHVKLLSTNTDGSVDIHSVICGQDQ
jgi:hypothetical protein